MRILIATGVYPPESGGPATNTKLLEEQMPARGFSVDVLPFRTVRHFPLGVRHTAYFLRLLRMARCADMLYAQDAVSVGLPAALFSLCLRSEEHTSELQSRLHLVCRLLLEKTNPQKDYAVFLLCLISNLNRKHA